ncbi:DUF1877 family protein [Fodinicola acaciae]|uniref:DUF1877 family protein n=1 Tax=Fodinicola acaciae TaxID=2681555 RepID=UPI0013D49792|nr:DUF1877 family protein [Fodinicola acaciae]
MASVGRHFMLTSEQDDQLLKAADDAARLAVVERLGKAVDDENSLVTGGAWDAIHRCLTDGTLNLDGGDDPLAHAVLGGRHLCESDHSFISHLTAQQVAATATALDGLDKDWLLSRYRKLTSTDYDGPYDSDDFIATWDNLTNLRGFLQRAATARRAVIFTVDFD